MTWDLVRTLDLALVAIGALMLVIRHKALGGTLPRSGFAGLRTKASKHCDACWGAMHRTAAPWLLAGAVQALVGATSTGMLYLVAADRAEFAAGVIASVAFVVSGILLLVGGFLGNRAASAESEHV